MRVFIAGATGVLGRRLVADCAQLDHEVVGLTRDDRGDELVSEGGGEPRRGDVLDRDTLVAAADGADVIIHAATKIPTGTKPSGEEWTMNDRVRREGTENLVDVADAVGADRFVLQSIVWVARQPDGSAFDETTTPHPDRSTRSALEAEEILDEAADDLGFDPVILRGGWFYAHDTAHTRRFGEGLLARKLPIVGRGLLGRQDATLSFIHVDDAAQAFAVAAEGTATGTFHVVDDQPATYARFLRSFAKRLGAPPPRRVPAWLARFFVGPNALRLLTTSMPTTNDTFVDAFDWSPTYPTIEAGLEQVVERWQKNGTLRSKNGGFEWSGD